MSAHVGHCSASSIAAYKSCPQRYRLRYVEGLTEAVKPELLRMGTAWHRGLEVLAWPVGTGIESFDPDAALIDLTEENRLELAIESATRVYETIPDWADPTEWAVERETLANALAAYHWLYRDQNEYEVVATELSFELPLVNPETGRPTPNMVRVGKIDQILRRKNTGVLLIGEHKTTSKPIDSDSSYWGRLRLDTQSKFYIVAARDCQDAGQIQSEPNHTNMVSGLLHDVFHKPQISPKKLTMAESAEFVKTGEYCGQQFGTRLMMPGYVEVGGERAEAEPGKKEGTFALRETPGMFGARLLQDMTTRPEVYFARREIAFTDQELEAFRHQTWALQRNMCEMERTGYWFQNEEQCEATFKCCYCSICYNNVDTTQGQTPPGFKRNERTN